MIGFLFFYFVSCVKVGGFVDDFGGNVCGGCCSSVGGGEGYCSWQ